MGPQATSVRMMDQTRMMGPPADQRSASARQPIARSALWAAWGDAIGFPTELVDEHGLQQRLLGDTTDALPRAWMRRIGGRMGPMVELPAGAYSDDTQLRLAVARCIRAPGGFDVEAFSKIELSVFPSYQLGAGRGTKAAAQELRRKGARWYASFFDRQGSSYVQGGGNGAAMRIQPHVWASPVWRPEAYLPAVLRDTLSTHGHPRALVGSMLHALSLGTALHEREVPSPKRWVQMGRYLGIGVELLSRDAVLAERWLFEWERRSSGPWEQALMGAVEETVTLLALAADMTSSGEGLASYPTLAKKLGGLDPRTRGAGTISAVLALWAAWQGQPDPERALRRCASLLGSDTDTVASMAGALLGVVATEEPPGKLQDRDLIRRDANRLAELRLGMAPDSFPHPDPLNWYPPATQADALGTHHGEPHVAGLGPARLCGDPIQGQGTTGGLWQWAQLAYGQTVLIKRRRDLAELPDSSLPRPRGRSAPAQASLIDATPVSNEEVVPPPSASGEARVVPRGAADLPTNVEDAVRLAVRSGLDERLTTQLLVHFARLSNGPYLAGLFAYRLAETITAPRDDGTRAPRNRET